MELLGAIPIRRLWQDWRYNRPATANYNANYSAGDPVGMALQLGNWPTIAGRLESQGKRMISSMFDKSTLTSRLTTTVARQLCDFCDFCVGR